MNRLNLSALVLTLASSLCGLTALAAGPQAAPAAAPQSAAANASAVQWLSVVDSGGYAKSWDLSSAYFRSKITKAAWTNSLTGVRKPLGSLVGRQLVKSQHMTSMPGAPDGNYHVLQFQTAFQNKKQAVETVTEVLEKDGKWRMTGYFIQ
jgi:hypothetical protein